MNSRPGLPILSATIWQSRKAFQYLDGIFNQVPALRKLVKNQTSDTISLTTRVDIECRPANYRSIRGGTAAAFICDEVAHWYDEASGSSNPDSEVLTAVRPCLATTNGPLIAISTPYARRGELFAAYKRDYGPDGDPLVLVAKASSLRMNSGLSAKVIDRAFERDPTAAASEYGQGDDISFRTDVEAFLTREIIDAVTFPGRYELPPLSQFTYLAFCDPSGGSGDDMTLAIAHREGDIAVLDCIRCAYRGDYVKDDRSTIDAMARSIADSAKVRDAVKKGKRGVALLFDEQGEMSVVQLGEGPDITVRKASKEEAELGWLKSYEQNSGENFERSVAESHEHSNRMGNKFPPQVKLGAGDAAAADAARIAAERKAKQAKMTADAKRFNQESFARNERIAAAGKAAVEKMWPKDSPKAVGR